VKRRDVKHPGRALRRIVAVAAFAFLVWAAGLYLFAALIPEPGAASGEKTDAIVVLTGGAGRVSEGLSLLAAGSGRKLFVSGVYQGVDVRALLRLAQRAPGDLECCIALGYVADSTRGNAVETVEWMTREGFTSIRLVTASYHMPRSLLEFRHALPSEIRVVPHPVFPAGFYAENWWRWRGSARLAISEYHKYILARMELLGRMPK
jgi:uncharacterized SAM-binding protein YcdF (DUF218 family)